MEKSKWKEHDENINLSEYDCDGIVPNRGHGQPMMSSSASSSSSPSTPAYIQHPISKFDTLAGIAIKYGVEVADIKKMNDLVTDRQMFALLTLHIPLHGRHPPSPCLPKGSGTATGHDNADHSPPENACCEPFESCQSMRRKPSEQNLSPVICSLQHYYGTKPTMKKSKSEIFNMAEYGKRVSNSSPLSSGSLSRHQKSRYLANGALDDIKERSDIMEVVEARESDSDKWNDAFVRRHNKSEANLNRIPELVLKQDYRSVGGFSPRSAKGLAQRQNAGSRVSLTTISNQYR